MATQWQPAWISDWLYFSYFRSRGCYSVSFNSNRPKVWEEKSKIVFQDGGYGGHFGLPIGMILAIFHLQVNLLLHPLFQLNSPCGLRENVLNRFSRWQLCRLSWILIDTILAHFDPEVILLLQGKFWLKSTKSLGRDVENWFSRWRLWRPSGIFDWLSFSYFVFIRHPDAPHQVSAQ